jgi:hypothetical protein
MEGKLLQKSGYTLLDEGLGNNTPDKLSDQKYTALREAVAKGQNCAVVEATLFFEPFRQQALSYLKGLPLEVEWIAFENDVETANHNCVNRLDKPNGKGHVDINNYWREKIPYSFPPGVKPKKIHKLPDKK